MYHKTVSRAASLDYPSGYSQNVPNSVQYVQPYIFALSH
jgi:hypothetical protein